MGRLSKSELEKIAEEMRKRLPDVIPLDLPKEKYEDVIKQANIGILRLSGRWCDMCNHLKNGSTFYEASTDKYLCFEHIIHEWNTRDLVKASEDVE